MGRQGKPVTTLTPSQRLTAKAEFDQSARTLANAAEAYLDGPLNTGKQFDLIDALAAFRRAEAALRSS